MPQSISTIDQFAELYCGKDMLSDEVERKKAFKALERAYDMMKFEMELYWKRATYFWGFLVVSFTAYFLVIDTKFTSHPELSVLVCSVGMVFSFGWYLVNRGSKYWQNNWYFVIVSLEALLKVPSHNLTRKNKKGAKNLIGAFPFSITKVHNIICLFVMFVWLLLLCSQISKHLYWSIKVTDLPADSIVLITGTFATIWGLWKTARGKETDDDIAFIFKQIQPSEPLSSTLGSTIRYRGQAMTR